MDERKADEVTVSMLREARPDGLFEYFRARGIRIENPFCGIYYVLDAVLFPTQIIVSRELDRKSHIWLKALSDRMDRKEMEELLEKVESMKQKFDRELAGSVLEVSIRANRRVIEELRGDDSMCQALLEIMEPEINKIKEAAVEAAVEKNTMLYPRAINFTRTPGARGHIRAINLANHNVCEYSSRCNKRK